MLALEAVVVAAPLLELGLVSGLGPDAEQFVRQGWELELEPFVSQAQELVLARAQEQAHEQALPVAQESELGNLASREQGMAQEFVVSGQLELE